MSGKACDAFAMAVFSPYCDNCGSHIACHSHRESWRGVPLGGEPHRVPLEDTAP